MGDNDCSQFNISCDCHYQYQYYDYEDRVVLGLLALPIMAFGICANLTSVRIFTHRLMSTSSINWYLAAMSASDTIILIASFCVLSMPRLGEYLLTWNAAYWSYMIAPIMFGLMTMGQTMSVYLTVGVSVHRYIGVCHPYKATQLLPKSLVAHFILGIIIFSILFNISRFFEVRVSNVCYRININYYMPHLMMTELRHNETYLMIFHGWALTILMFVVPFTLLIGFNSMVLHAVRKSRRAHMCGGESDEMSRKAERKERQTSIMLVAVVILFISCNSLAFICNMMENLGFKDFSALVTANNMTVIINASVNIFIYMLFSEKYRLLLRHYLCCDWSRQGEMLLNSVMA
ncbi:unnamed protein product, partial [Mesorhabditis belari]|uniref:G-protein coupled receptors family 1 profile domain-containing protein n=1 Tax=Mesorhabditis belari TaxID=2138241 RepID=A0AAF3FNJ7_9BILA